LIKAIGAGAAISLAVYGWAPATEAKPARQKWVQVGHNKGTLSYVDRLSYERSGDLVRFDGRIKLKKPDPAGVSTIRHRSEVDCAARTMRLLSFSGHRRNGAAVTGFSFPGDGAAAAVVSPGSNGERTLDFVCSGGKP
jgi:hypothetical protein